MNFIKRTVNYFKVRKEKDVAKELDKKFVILFGLTSWVEVYDKGNKEYLNKEDVKVYSFSDGITYYGIKNPSEQTGLVIGISANEQVIKHAKEILSYITIRNCDYQFIDNFKFSMRNKKIF